MIVEAVCTSVRDAVLAQECGADRIELVSSIELGGLTPSAGLVREVERACDLPIMAMIRPRAGGFVYSKSEIETMKADVMALGDYGARGIVFGCLTEDDEVDVAACAEILDDAYGYEKIFHRAFDRVRDPVGSVDTLVKLGFHRILTTGQTGDAIAHAPLIKQLRGIGGIEILVCGGLRPVNVRQAIEATGADQIHLGPMLRLGESEGFFGEGYDALDGDSLREVVRIVRALTRDA